MRHPEQGVAGRFDPAHAKNRGPLLIETPQETENGAHQGWRRRQIPFQRLAWDDLPLHRTCCNERSGLLVLVHPVGRDRAAQRDQLRNPPEVVGQIPCKDWLMVRDPVPQGADVLQLVINRLAILPDGLRAVRSLRQAREDTRHVGDPQTIVVTSREHLLPEYKFEFRNHLARGGVRSARVPEVITLAVTRARGRQALLETCRPRPVLAVNGLQGVRDCVPNDYLTDVQRRQEGSGNLSIPGVEVQCLAGRDRVPCRVERGLVSADPGKG